MDALNKDWITEKMIDFEYKQYVLLAYLSEVNKHFESNCLYPDLTELIEHYKNTVLLKESKNNLSDTIQKKAVSFDWQTLQLIYEKAMQDDTLMDELENIINFSIPKFEYYLREGKKIYNFIEEKMNIEPIGLLPLNTDEGYLFLKDGQTADTNVFEYQITLYEQPNEKFRGIYTHFVTAYKSSFTNTYESIKSELIRANRNIPNPAVFAVESELQFPMQESFLPIAKRSLLRYVSQNTSNRLIG